MQQVSKAYRDSMKSSLRERAYIMISFGLVNQEAQSKAQISSGEFAYYSDESNIFGEHSDDIVYATLEEDFTKVDGSMYFLPRESISSLYFDTGLVSKNLLTQKDFEIIIDLNSAIDFKGITIDFGENYPVNFDLVSDSGQTIEIRNNTSAVFTTEEVFESTTQVKLLFYKMKNENSRVRIYSILFGYGLVYYNSDVMSSSLESYISPIGADVPQIDFTVQLKNYDHYFNVDNPKSAINFLETGQEVDIYYGYQLPDGGDIEWIKGNRLQCSDWESDDYTATIRCQDIFRNMDSEYYKGTYSSVGVNYYSLAENVLDDAGLSDYYIDPLLKDLYTKNPLPRVNHKEALQIIANACRCVLSQTRNGTIQIKSSFIPEATANATTQASYSNVESIIDGTVKDEYASLATNYTTADGVMYFLPRSLESSTRNTGYVSAEISNESCEFESNPVVTIEQEVACRYYGVKFTFGQSVPAEFILKTYNDNELVATYTVKEDEIEKTTVLNNEFYDFDKMTIEFTKTAEPFSRIVLNNFSFGDITSFTMTRNDMTSSPKAIKQELVKEIIVPCYSYQNGTEEENLMSQEVVVTSGSSTTFYLNEPSYNFRATLNESDSGVTIQSSGNYYVTVTFSVTGTFQLDIFGYRYKVVERYATKSLNSKGTSIKWENPLISEMEMAVDLAEWLGDYYSASVEYEYDTRGNPEIDVNDIIYQENSFYKNLKVNVYRQTLNFNQSFSGKVTTRRIGSVTNGVAST